jgi:hypothetical protein
LKAACTNIVKACNFLEHRENFINKPRYKDIDYELVLGEERMEKMN